MQSRRPLLRKTVYREKIAFVGELEVSLIRSFNGNDVGERIRAYHNRKFVRSATHFIIEVDGDTRFFLDYFGYDAPIADIYVVDVAIPVDRKTFGTFLFPLLPRKLALGKNGVRAVGIFPAGRL